MRGIGWRLRGDGKEREESGQERGPGVKSTKKVYRNQQAREYVGKIPGFYRKKRSCENGSKDKRLERFRVGVEV